MLRKIWIAALMAAAALGSGSLYIARHGVRRNAPGSAVVVSNDADSATTTLLGSQRSGVNEWETMAQLKWKAMTELKPRLSSTIALAGNRMRLDSRTVATLQRWNHLVLDRTIAIYRRPITSQPEWEAMLREEADLRMSAGAAERRLLRGSERANQFEALLFHAWDGTIDQVDDNGDWRGRKSSGESAKFSHKVTSSVASRFDSLFQD
jgi:hypothetical protein